MFTWTAELTPGSPTTSDDLAEVGVGQQFDTQEQAEAWLASFWAELSDLDVASVTLMDDDRLVYGPMGLSADA